MTTKSKSAPSASGATTTLYSRVNAIIDEVAQVCLERHEAARGIILALLAQRSAFFLGAPGVAKSMTIDETVKRITGANHFDILMTRFTEPGEVFGPLDIKALEQGLYMRNPAGMLPEAHVGFLDEVFKANSAILNALLKILNERTWRNGQSTIKVPLIAAIGASNETPQGEDLSALYDRFLMRVLVEPIGDDNNVVKMLQSPAPPPPTKTITLKELQFAHKEVEAVKVTDDTVTAYMRLRADLLRNGLRPSDRRFRQTVALIQASAWLAGRDETLVDDLEVGVYVFWNNREERTKVRGYVLDVAAPGLKAAMEKFDLATEQVQIIRTAHQDDEATKMDGMTKLRKIVNKEMASIAKDSPSARVQELHQKAKDMLQEMVKQVMGAGE